MRYTRDLSKRNDFYIHVNVTACVPVTEIFGNAGGYAYVHVKVHASAWFLDKYPKTSISKNLGYIPVIFQNASLVCSIVRCVIARNEATQGSELCSLGCFVPSN